MAESKTEYFLRNINAKLGNFYKYVWFCVIQWLVALPFFILGLIFQIIGETERSGGFMGLSILFYILAISFIIGFFVFALISLFKSTKDIQE